MEEFLKPLATSYHAKRYLKLAIKKLKIKLLKAASLQ